jgi:tetratricopeptide (TPR) repeat protein
VLRAVMRRLIGHRSPAVWVFVASACRVISYVARHRHRWLGRAGFAWLMAGDHTRGRDALASAVRVSYGSDEFNELIDRLTREAIPDDHPAAWYYNLGVCLRQLGEAEFALTLVRAACQRHADHARWLRQLAQLEEQVGDIPAAVAALEGLVSLRGDADPRPRLDLASLHQRAGQWRAAQVVLAENIGRHAKHAESQKLLAESTASIDLWGGTFTDTLPERTDGLFDFHVPEPGSGDATAAGSASVAALIEAVELRPGRPQWRAALADARQASGDLEGAIGDYEAALEMAETTDDRWALAAKQRLQFQLERCYHRLGKGRVTDPLFDLVIQPTGVPATGTHKVPGFYTARHNYAGVTVTGFLGSADCKFIKVSLNGVLIRTVNISRGSYLPQFTMLIKRTALTHLPRRGRLEVRTSDERPLLGPRGVSCLELEAPHGDGRLLEIITAGGGLNKKGEIKPTPQEVRLRQDRDLEIYARVRDFLQDRLGRPIFLLYGTLLGYYREGDFIPGDDDFDAGYVSDRTDPVEVKEEAQEIIVELVRAGFTVSFNQRGRLFRVQLDRRESYNCHVDIHPMWFQDGRVWAHNALSRPGASEEYLPVVAGTLRGVEISIPHQPEAFLRNNYGPGWRTPDPGFRYYPSNLEPAVRRNLAKALMTVGEYRALATRVEREVRDLPNAGRLVSIGSQDLYPLSEYLTQ